MTVVDLTDKGHLGELFDKLRSGRHLSAEDGPLYLALRTDYGTYRALFAALGFDLVEHERGFYYFRSSEDLGKEATQLAVFVFVLVEAWGDAGKDLETTALDPAGQALADLPHLTREGWRRCMAEADSATPEDLARIVQRLERLGFAEAVGEDRFRFRAPVWRFFDLCLEVLGEAEARELTSDESTSDEFTGDGATGGALTSDETTSGEATRTKTPTR